MNGTVNISEANTLYQYYIDTNLGLVGYPIVGSIQIGMLIKMIFEHHDKLEPVHIYEFSSLSSIAMFTAMAFISSFEKIYPKWMCCIFNPLFYFCKLACLSNWCLTSIDCCLALYWNLTYKARVTNKVAFTTVSVVNVIMVIICMIIVFVDQDILECNKSNLIVCNNIRKNNFYWNTIPVMMTFLIYFMCSIYIARVIKRQSKRVSPTVNLPTPIPVNIATVSRTNEEPSLNHLDLQSHADEIAVIEDVEDILEDIDEVINGEGIHKTEDLDKTQEVILNCVKIRRSSLDPYKFKKVETKMAFLKACSVPNIISEIDLQMAKKMFSLNLLSFLSVLCLIPLNIVHVYVFITGAKCEDDLDLITFGKIGCIMTSCGSLAYYLVAKRKFKR